MRMKLYPRYGLLSLAYVVGIYWLSSMDLRVMGGDPLIQLTLNLLHIPLYAGLAFCVLRAVSEGRSTEELRRGVSWLTIFVTGAYAALDEWHQYFVPGRHASVSDFLIDLVGIGGMLLILRWGALREIDSGTPLYRHAHGQSGNRYRPGADCGRRPRDLGVKRQF